jgi:hypothetical protein
MNSRRQPLRYLAVGAVFCLLVGAVYDIVPAKNSQAAQPTTRPDIERELLNFEFNGSSIHPGCVYELRTELSDLLPIAASIDLEGCSKSNRYSVDKPVAWNGMLRFEDAQQLGGGYFAYRHVGSTPTGDHVLVTELCGGGSGIFRDVLVVRFSRDQVFESERKRNRLLMTRVGAFVLGDCDDGKVTLDGDRLTIGRSRYRKDDIVITLK